MVPTRRQFVTSIFGMFAGLLALRPSSILARCAQSVVDLENWIFTSVGENNVGPLQPGPLRSFHVETRDGIRLALDLVLPSNLKEGQKVPTILIMTRYWRAEKGAELDRQQQFFSSHGFAVIIGDVRGTGASFGKWPHHRSRDETLDFGDIIDWVVEQPWSNRELVGWGSSYTANTADWMVERKRTSLKAVVSRFPDYDPYTDLYFPGGVPNSWMGRVWGASVKNMDLNVKAPKNDKPSPGVRPVDGSEGDSKLEKAIEARQAVPSVWVGLSQVTFRDDRPESWHGASMDDWGIHSHRNAVEEAGTPMQSWAGWMDAGTANGVLHRFMTLSNPQWAIIGPWSHGAYHDANPYRHVNEPVTPSLARQDATDLRFIRQVLTGDPELLSPGYKRLAYYTMGEDRWKVTSEWPPSDTETQELFFGPENSLTKIPPNQKDHDVYEVDFSATTGSANRWTTNNDGRDVDYGDRSSEDKKLLTYTSTPLKQDVEITGQPVVTIYIASNRTDGNFFAYLEDVDPDGNVRYVTDGQLRAIHRKISADPPPYHHVGPYHSFLRRDAMPLEPGKIAELMFEMMPVSVLVRKGHQIRVAISCADADTFARVPEYGDVEIQLHRSESNASRISLPVIERPTKS